MRIHFSVIGKFSLEIGLSVLFLLIFWKTIPVFADDVQPDPVQVTAIVSDLVPPSTPILISPENGAKLRITTIPFVWKGSTDNWLMDHYTLTVNDSVLFDDIPLEATSSAEYDLTYDSGTDYYTLTPTQTFSDGSYDWDVTAWDYHGNSAVSVDWTFTIDTQAPSFAITKVEDKTVNITTSDSSSVPTDPIQLEENEPTLSGTGEANSTVHLTLTYPDGSIHEVTFTIGSDGTWSVTLDELPRDGKILLDFLITDPTGNVSILEDVPLILYSPTVTIPVPSSIPLLPSHPSIPAITIPILPPIEYIPPIIKEPVKKIPKRVVYFVRNIEASVKESTITWLEKLLTVVALLLLVPLPLTKLSILNFKHRHYLSRQLVKEFFWLVGPTPKKHPQGIVVNRNTMAAIPYALVLFSGTTSTGEHVSNTRITNEQGIFPYEELPEGEYRISIHHSKYFFPSLSKVPQHLDWNSFYTGASFTVKNGTLIPALSIPVELLEKQRFRLLDQVTEGILSLPELSIPLLFIIGVVTLFFPSIINITVTAIYTVFFLKKKFWSPGEKMMFMIADPQKKGIKNAICVVKSQHSELIEKIQQTNEKGEAEVKLVPDQYQFWCVDFKHKLTEGDNKTSTSIKTDKSKHYLPLILE